MYIYLIVTQWLRLRQWLRLAIHTQPLYLYNNIGHIVHGPLPHASEIKGKYNVPN